VLAARASPHAMPPVAAAACADELWHDHISLISRFNVAHGQPGNLAPLRIPSAAVLVALL